MLPSSEKGKFEERKNRKMISRITPILGYESKKANLLYNSPPIRKEKVKEAKKKKQNGEYNSEEVYKRIADRLMDLFGIQ